jgi:hypothetical protein
MRRRVSALPGGVGVEVWRLRFSRTQLYLRGVGTITYYTNFWLPNLAGFCHGSCCGGSFLFCLGRNGGYAVDGLQHRRTTTCLLSRPSSCRWKLRWMACKKVLDSYLWFYIALLIQFPAETLLVHIANLQNDTSHPELHP